MCIGQVGNVGIGTDTPGTKLSINGALSLASTTPASTTYSLYNVGGALFWNGTEVGSGSDDQTAAEILAALITVDGASSDLDADLLDGISSATFALDTDVDDLSGVSDASTARTNLGLEVGTDVQAFNSNLTTYAGITPAANTQSFLAAVNYATMRGLLDLEAGTDFYAMSAADTAFEGELDDSAGLAGALSDETGTGNAVFSASPTLTGTLDAVAGDFSATLTMSGSLANIALGSNFLSGDGDDEGVFVNSDGNVGIGTDTPGSLLTVAGNMELTGFFYDSAGSSGIFGDVLQRGSSGLTWVATSTLGIGGAGEDDTVVSQTFTSSSTWHALTGLSASTTVGVTLDTTNLVTGSLSLVVDGATTTVLAGTTFVGLVVANSTVSVVAEESDAFDVSTASFVDSFDVSGQEANPYGLAFSPDGLKMFVLGYSGRDVNEYTLSTTFDVSTASFVDSFSVSGQETSPTGLTFSTDGLKMFVLGGSGDDVNEYTLSTTFDVSTASFVDSFSVSGQETSPTGLTFSTDGLKMFVLGGSGDDVNEYTLSTTFDVSTASFVDSFSVSGQETNPADVAFSTDGLKMFVMGYTGKDINEYTLSSTFDVSTASFVDSFSVSGQASFPFGLTFSPDGLKMFVADPINDAVHEYTLAAVSFTGSASALITTEGDFGGADLAELYPVTDTNIAAGDIVSFIDNDSFALTYATAESSHALAGVVSTAPGITLSDSTEGREAVPLALSGRVPVKVNLEGGLIVPGDRITPSSVPGVGRKATLFEPSIGTALTAYNPENPDEQQLVTVFVRLEEGVNIYNLTDTLFTGATTTFILPQSEIIASSSASSTTASSTDSVISTENIWSRLARLASQFRDGVLTLFGLQVQEIETEDIQLNRQLCVGAVCVGEAEFAEIFGDKATESGARETTSAGTTQLADDNDDTTAQSSDDTNASATTTSASATTSSATHEDIDSTTQASSSSTPQTAENTDQEADEQETQADKEEETEPETVESEGEAPPADEEAGSEESFNEEAPASEKPESPTSPSPSATESDTSE